MQVLLQLEVAKLWTNCEYEPIASEVCTIFCSISCFNLITPHVFFTFFSLACTPAKRPFFYEEPWIYGSLHERDNTTKVGIFISNSLGSGAHVII